MRVTTCCLSRCERIRNRGAFFFKNFAFSAIKVWADLAKGAFVAIERDVFLRLFIRQYDILRAYTWQFLYDDSLVEEALQEFAITTLGKLSQIRNAEHFLPWAKVTCRNLAHDTLRKQRRQPIALSNEVLDLLEGEWRQYDDAETSNRISAMRKCLAKLPPPARWLVELRYGRGLRFAQDRRGIGQQHQHRLCHAGADSRYARRLHNAGVG